MICITRGLLTTHSPLKFLGWIMIIHDLWAMPGWSLDSLVGFGSSWSTNWIVELLHDLLLKISKNNVFISLHFIWDEFSIGICCSLLSALRDIARIGTMSHMIYVVYCCFRLSICSALDMTIGHASPCERCLVRPWPCQSRLETSGNSWYDLQLIYNGKRDHKFGHLSYVHYVNTT